MRLDAPSYDELLAESSVGLQAKLSASPEEAARWVEAAAHHGSKPAIIHWGQMLLDGHGTKRDPEAAYRWFKIAAETGYPDGINMVGRCHELGWGTDIDAEKAARCYNLAAAQGHHWACFNLGQLLLAGHGVGRDVRKALSLFVYAARSKNAKAMNMIGRYREEGLHGRPNLAAAMRWYGRAAVRGCFRGQFHFARFQFAMGRPQLAKEWLAHSIAGAPLDFCQDIIPILDEHPNEDVRSAADLARAKAASQTSNQAKSSMERRISFWKFAVFQPGAEKSG